MPEARAEAAFGVCWSQAIGFAGGHLMYILHMYTITAGLSVTKTQNRCSDVFLACVWLSERSRVCTRAVYIFL